MNGKNDNALSSYWGIFDNYLFFILGYTFFQEGLIQSKFLTIVTFVISIFCLLTISNYIFNIPNWISPIEQLRVELLSSQNVEVDEIPLFSSGFGLGRTGWGHTIVLFLPICLLGIYKKKKYSLIYFLCVLGSIIVCGSRGALFIALLLLLLFLHRISRKNGTRQIVIFFCLFFLVFVVLFTSSWWITHFRLDANDLTTGREEQYSYIGTMLQDMPFWGLGVGGTHEFLNKYGISHDLHNTYVRIFLEYGVVVGFSLLLFAIYSFKRVLGEFLLHNKCDLKFCSALIVLSGLISAMIEPSAVFGARAWYVVWWFFLGVLYNKNNQAYEDLIKS